MNANAFAFIFYAYLIHLCFITEKIFRLITKNQHNIHLLVVLNMKYLFHSYFEYTLLVS